MPWKRKTTTTWAKMPFGPTGHTYIPDLVIEAREIVTSADLVRHHIMHYAPWTQIGRDIALLDLKQAWEVRMPGAEVAIALVILLQNHRGAAGAGDLVSTRLETRALGRRDRTLIVTGGGIYPSRGSNKAIAFSHLADRIVEAMTPAQLDTLYVLSGSPQVPPDMPRLEWLHPSNDRLHFLRSDIQFRPPTLRQEAFVEAAIRTTVGFGVPSYAKDVCGVAVKDGETVAVLQLFDDNFVILAIPEETWPELDLCDGDGRPFHYDWHLASWVRIDALAA